MYRPRIALLIGLFLAGPAQAELGGGLATVRADGARMNAWIASASGGRFMRHDLARANTGMVHEFTNASGQVFAVTWSGPGKPDLRALLGRYFGALQTTGAVEGRRIPLRRRPLQIARSDLQIQAAGHMGWFRGVAFLPALAPAGFSTADLPQP